MLRDSENENGELILSTARIVHIQPIEVWGSQPILRQALLSPEKPEGEDKVDPEAPGGSPQKIKNFSSDFIDVHLYPAGSEALVETVDYSGELLADLSSGSSLPALTSAQLSSLLSELPSSQPRTLCVSLDCKIPGAEKEARMEERTHNGKNYFGCLRCDFICLSPERAVSHQCPGPPKKITCLACKNTFKSTAVLKAHLLIDHGVSVEEHPAFIAMNIGEQYQEKSRNSSGTGTMVSGGKPSGERASVRILHSDMSVKNPGPEAAEESENEPLHRHQDSDPETLPPPPGFSLFASVETFLVDDGVGKLEVERAEDCNQKEMCLEEGPQDTKPIKLEKHSSPKLRCSLAGCSAKLSEQSNMEYHLLCHNGEGGWKCPECGSGDWQSWGGLSVHLWRSHGLDMELYSCDLCDYKTNSMSKLMNLHRRTHGDDRPFLCDSCGKGFKTPKQLRNHKHMVHRRNKEGDGTKRLENLCSTCGRNFTSSRRLQQHVDFVHRQIKPYLCPECGHAAASKSALKLHLRQHTGEKPYACEECDFCTSDHNTLRKHKMRHSGERQYSCPYCPYACIQTSTYKLHLKNKHPGINDGLLFTCEVCPFKTIKKEIFLAHTSTHSLQQIEHEFCGESIEQDL